MASLYLFENGTQISRFPLASSTITVGRLKSNDIVLDNAGVSRHHLRIDGDPTGSTFVMEDLQSLNGTFVGGKKVAACVLRNGDEIHLGKHSLLFEDA
ncbi:MAG: FHA domain-containing protein [Fibrobacteria bacterium]|nr:FHA domain-containing protein [Fibrobacteria bacterium]